jgi:hypothetical protein
LPFADLLPESKIQRAFEDAGANFATAENEIYSPAVTFWAFLSQMLFKDEQRSCTAAVARVVVLCVALAKKSPLGKHQCLLPRPSQVARVRGASDE